MMMAVGGAIAGAIILPVARWLLSAEARPRSDDTPE